MISLISNSKKVDMDYGGIYALFVFRQPKKHFHSVIGKIKKSFMDLAEFESAASTCFVDAPVGDDNAKVAIYQADP